MDRYDPDPSFEEICQSLHIELSPEFEELDQLLDDPELFDLFKQDFQQRYPNSLTTGRPSTPVEVLIRALTLKDLSADRGANLTKIAHTLATR